MGAFAASLALGLNIMGPLIFFVVWNVVRLAFKWYTQELGYAQGSNITKDLSGGIMRKITTGASILGMFIMGVLIPRWTTIDLSKIVLSNADMGAVSEKFPAITTLTNLFNDGGSVTPDVLAKGIEGLKNAASNGYSIVMNTMSGAADPARFMKLTTLQSVLDQLLPGLMALVLTLVCTMLLRKKVNPIVIIFGLFAVGIAGALIGFF